MKTVTNKECIAIIEAVEGLMTIIEGIAYGMKRAEMHYFIDSCCSPKFRFKTTDAYLKATTEELDKIRKRLQSKSYKTEER